MQSKSNTIKPTQSHIAPALSSPKRLQDYGITIFEGVDTKSALKKVLKKKQITVDGIVATTATFIKGGEVIDLYLLEKTAPKKKLIFPLKVLFEDDYLALIHKPAGILVSGNSFKTIANALVQNLKISSQPDATTPQPVHRLDFATTGVLLVGKTSTSIRLLNKLFENRAVKNTYYAITIGTMPKCGKINSDIDDKTSESIYSCCESVASVRFGKLNLVKLEPQTGRRHQLRKHLCSIGNPILGDKDYGIENLILKGQGLYLHAYAIKFRHPFTHKDMDIKDDFPERFKKIFPNL
ncbi:MAG TPA: RluA family pseudouridine synthase [Flavobacterium sp.]|nr:RluA family pseudouridine synthase [Flavobacterium sp.]